MSTPSNDFVRPTRRCLDDLGVAVPHLTEPLHDVDHPLVKKSQNLPKQNAAGGAERIISLTDRIWLKVKTGRWRGAATCLTKASSSERSSNRRRPLGAGGRRALSEIVARSLRCGQKVVAEFRHHRVSALVRADDGQEAYLAIGAEGLPDERVIALILASVPGVPAEDD